jgi:hypothetical protein
MERLARGVRVSLMALALLAGVLAPATVIQARGRLGSLWSASLIALGRTHYRRLLATFAAATLLPLLGLSLLVSGYMRAEVERHVEEVGLQGILSAGSLARTILETGEEDELEDDTLYWLSQLVGVDVILYEEGELAAASRRELFSSGLLSPRMEGSVYRRLALEERRYAMGRQSVRELDYRTIAAPVVTGDGRRRGMLSLPLEAQTSEAALGIQKIEDVTLITFVGMVLLMGAVGYLLALRVSRPIRSLRAAAARIAAGDLDAVVRDRPRDETAS